MSETPIERQVRTVLKAAGVRARHRQPLIAPETVAGAGIVLAHAVLLIVAFLGGMRLVGPAMSAFILWPGLAGLALQVGLWAAGVRNGKIFAAILTGSSAAVLAWLWSRSTNFSG